MAKPFVSVDFMCDASKSLQAAHGSRLLGDWFPQFQSKLAEAEALYKSAPRASRIAPETTAPVRTIDLDEETV